VAVEIARLPEQIRGYEDLKLQSAQRARRTVEGLLVESRKETAA
jgi:hypothetical protein